MGISTAWKFDRYHRDDLPMLINANREEYGDTDLTSTSYFEWVQNNPNGQPLFQVARDEGGRIIGWVIFLPFHIFWNGENKKMLLGFNLMVRKEYRRQGLSTEMIKHAMSDQEAQEYQFMIALANSKSTAVHQKMGDIIVSPIPMVVRPLDIQSLADKVISSPLVRLGVRAAWKIAGATIYRQQHTPGRDSHIQVKENTIGPQFDAFWDKVKRKYPICLVRDQKFLHWRFCELPIRSYRVFTAWQRDDILGYVVVRLADIRGISCGLISDFMVVPGEDGNRAGLLLMNEATRHINSAGVQLAGGLMFPHTQEYRIMRRAGYLISPKKFAPQSITLISHAIRNEIPVEQLIQPQSWFISNADHDAV